MGRLCASTTGTGQVDEILSVAEAAGEDARPPDQITLVYSVLCVYFPRVIL